MAQLQQKSTHNSHRDTSEAFSTGDKRDCSPGLHLLHKATLSRLRDVADLPKSQKLTEKQPKSENKETWLKWENRIKCQEKN